MSAGGQKQEVRVLAMAIGALVIAVALFVAVRSLSNKPATASSSSSATKKTTAKEPKEQPKKAEKAAPPAASNRDPFASVGASEISFAPRGSAAPSARRELREPSAAPARGGELESGDLRLSGILRGSSGATAVVHLGEARYYANLGDQVGGYTLVKIGSNSVVLSQGGHYYTLTIQPEPGSGSRTRARTTTRRR